MEINRSSNSVTILLISFTLSAVWRRGMRLNNAFKAAVVEFICMYDDKQMYGKQVY